MTKVIVYSTPHCPYCTMVKNFLKEKGVEFLEKDVLEDSEAAKEMVKKSGNLGVPQTEINGKIIVGFDRIALEEELEDIK